MKRKNRNGKEPQAQPKNPAVLARPTVTVAVLQAECRQPKKTMALWIPASGPVQFYNPFQPGEELNCLKKLPRPRTEAERKKQILKLSELMSSMELRYLIWANKGRPRTQATRDEQIWQMHVVLKKTFGYIARVLNISRPVAIAACHREKARRAKAETEFPPIS